ncbi:hypothetical protein ACIHFD_66620 [Nonomuraea sp. NPDC051941]|uniref:hypothetical protein n=1 Tax=Nonomuraea sp. NPDC051941 TaxID=3364373 RepID=UPI0037C93575
MSTLAERLRAGAAQRYPHEQAAVELLLDFHEPGGSWTWVSDEDFTNSCVVDDGTSATIDWDRAREWYSSQDFSVTVKNLRAALDFAISLGEERFNFRWMEKPESDVLATAAARAINWRSR